MNVDFDKVFLSSFDNKVLFDMDEYGEVTMAPPPEYLLYLGFVQRCEGDEGNGQYNLTEDGYRYLEYQRRKLEQEAKEKRMQKFQFWISLIVTNLISFAALIVSIIALSKQ